MVAGYAAKLIDLSPAGTYAVKIGVVIIFSIINIIGLDWLEKLETFFIVSPTDLVFSIYPWLPMAPGIFIIVVL